MTEKISIIVPVYNEERAILQTISEIKSVMEETKVEYELIIVNDASTDKTAKMLESAKNVNAITHKENKGYGASLKTGLKQAKNDYILIIDADGTYPVDAISKLLEYTDDFDMIVGARTGKNVHVPLLRKPAKLFLTLLANFLTNKKIPDLNSGLRIFKKSLAMRFFHLYPNGFSFTTTITMAALSNDYNVKYIPINYYKRKGKSTIHPVKDFLGFTRLILNMAVYFRPLKVFSLVSFVMLAMAVLIFLYSFFYLGRIMDVSISIFIVSAIQIFLFGVLAELISKKNLK